MRRMSKQSHLPSFPAWFRDNPGHLVRALPASFCVFSGVLVISLISGMNVSDSFVTASLMGCLAGVGRTALHYLRAVATAVRRMEGDRESSSGGFTWLELAASLAVVSSLLLIVVPILNRAISSR